MTICKKCGSENEDGACFCGSCGTYLEWAGEKVAEPAAVEAETFQDAEPQPAAVEANQPSPAPVEVQLPESPPKRAPEKVIDLASESKVEAKNKKVATRERPTTKGGSVFISYRRDDTAGQARALHDRFVQHLGRERVFMDVDSIMPGTDWPSKIEEALANCGLMLALIGKEWAIRASDGTRRLMDPNDYPRMEITAALEHHIPIIPVLVERATLPPTEELPESLRQLARRNALDLENTRWEYDMGRLLNAVEGMLGITTTQQTSKPSVIRIPEAEPPKTSLGSALKLPEAPPAAPAAEPPSTKSAETKDVEEAPTDTREARPPDKDHRAEALVAKPVKPTVPKRQPVAKPPDHLAARKPEPEKARPAAKAAPPPPTREIKPGELICGECGEGNDAARKFCRRCGTSLIAAMVAPEPVLPWWKKILRRKPKTFEAGYRPGRRAIGQRASASERVTQGARQLVRMVVALVLVAAVAVGGIIGVTRLINKAKSALGGKTQLLDVSDVRTGTSLAGHPVTGLIDGKNTTYWAVSGNGRGKTIRFTFQEPSQIVGMILTIRNNTNVTQYWPRVVEVEFFDARGAFIKSVTLAVKKAPQEDQKYFRNLINVSGVKLARLTIKEVTAPARGRQLSINEVQFYVPENT